VNTHLVVLHELVIFFRSDYFQIKIKIEYNWLLLTVSIALFILGWIIGDGYF